MLSVPISELKLWTATTKAAQTANAGPPCQVYRGPIGPIGLIASRDCSHTESARFLNETPFLLVPGNRTIVVDKSCYQTLNVISSIEIDLQHTELIAITFDRSELHSALLRDSQRRWLLIEGFDNDWSDLGDAPLTIDADFIPHERALAWMKTHELFRSSAWPTLRDAYQCLRDCEQHAVEHKILDRHGWHASHGAYPFKAAVHEGSVERVYKQADIARLLNVQRHTVHSWKKRAPKDFPKDELANATEWRIFISAAWPCGKYKPENIPI